MRFTDPFSNPFSTASAPSRSEPDMTGTLQPPAAAPAIPTASVLSAPLAAPAPVASAPLAAPGPAAIASRAPVTSSGPGGWTSQWGATVTVGSGDTLAGLSNRYGVPAQAILQANGLSGASQVSPGRQIVIPVYNAAGASAPTAAAPARVATPAPQPQTRFRLVEGPKPVADKDAPKPRVRPGMAGKPVPSAPPVAQKPAAPAPQQAAQKPAPKAPEPVRAAKAEPAKPVRPEPAKAARAVPANVVQAPAPKAEPPKVAAAKPEPAKAAQAPAPKPEPVKVAKVETPAPQKPVAAAPAPAPVAEAPKPEPAQTASLPSEPKQDFRWPARGRVIAGFGANGGNEGINIAVPEGTPVKAADEGTVTYAGNEVKGYGNLVLIRHENGYVSAYAHNGELNVKRGEKVKRGQVIAKAGQTGNVTSPQLHFEIRKGQKPVDPVPYLNN